MSEFFFFLVNAHEEIILQCEYCMDQIIWAA